MNRLKKNGRTLKFLQKASPPVQKSILEKAPRDLIDCLCDCAHNILKGNVPLTSRHKQKLRRHKKALRDLTKRKTSLASKRKIVQKGGFLSVLLSALAPVLGGLIGGLTK